jgi:uncharacterized protein
VTVVIDTGPLVAFGDRNDPLYPAVDALMRAEPGTLVVPAPVAAEADFMLRRRVGSDSARRFYQDIAAGRYEVLCLEREEYRLASDLDRQYEDLRLGLADLSVVVLAARSQTTRLLTFDERDFRAVTPLQGGTFTLLPADA